MKRTCFSLAILMLMSGCAIPADATYRFVASEEDVDSSIFFFANDTLVSDGGCRFFHVDKMAYSKDCDLPDNPRWVTPSPTGELLFVTSVSTNIASPGSTTSGAFKSYIFAVRSRKVIFSRDEVLYSSPIAIHPSGKIIATTELTNPDRPETASIKLSDERRHQVFDTAPAGNVADLRFVGDGGALVVDTWDGSQLTFCTGTTTLRPCDPLNPDKSIPYFLTSPDGRFIIKQERESVSISESRSGGLTLKIPIDTSRETGRFASYSSDSHRLAIKGTLNKDGKKTYGFIVAQLPQ